MPTNLRKAEYQEIARIFLSSVAAKAEGQTQVALEAPRDDVATGAVAIMFRKIYRDIGVEVATSHSEAATVELLKLP